MELPIQLINFINSNSGIKYDYMGYLPDCYADIDNFDKIQEGYRFNPLTDECLVSNVNGGWRNDWYVFAVNQMDDPFYIDFSQKDIGFPVYFSWHGAGKWDPIKVANTLEQFGQILAIIKANEINLPFDLNSLSLEADLDNEFWSEVNKYCKEYEKPTWSHFQISETGEVKDISDSGVDGGWCRLYISEIGENKISVMSLLRKSRNISLPEVKELIEKPPILVSEGLKHILAGTKERYEQAGCIMQLVKYDE